MKETNAVDCEPSTPVASTSDSNEIEISSSNNPKTLSVGAVRMRYLRKLQKAKTVNSMLTTKLRSVQQQLRRIKQQKSSDILYTSPKTPRSKTNYLMAGSPSAVRKTLHFHHALVDELSESNKKAKNTQEKQILSKVIDGKILKKYRVMAAATSAFGLRIRQINRHKHRRSHFLYEPKHYCRFSLANMKSVVEKFFLEDINSRASAGRNETITRNGDKKQKRYLNDNIKILHSKFCKDIGPISYNAFRMLKPFWVVTAVDRETCACKKCENVPEVGGKVATIVQSRSKKTKDSKKIAKVKSAVKNTKPVPVQDRKPLPKQPVWLNSKTIKGG